MMLSSSVAVLTLLGPPGRQAPPPPAHTTATSGQDEDGVEARGAPVEPSGRGEATAASPPNDVAAGNATAGDATARGVTAGDVTAVRERQRDAACRYIKETAASERAQLFSPALVGSLAMVGIGTPSTGDDTIAFTTTARMTLGARFSAARTRRGVLMARAAHVECAWTRASYDYLENAMAVPSVGVAEENEAIAAYLSNALPGADAIVAALRDRYDARLASVEELNGAMLRRDKLVASLAVAEETAARQHAAPLVAKGDELQAHRARATQLERDFERSQGRLRRNLGWDVEVFGGWDLVVGARGRVPAMLGLSATFVPGMLWQRRHDEKAAEARAAANEGGRWSTRLETDAAVAALRSSRSVRLTRLAELEIFAAELRARQQALQSLGELESSVVRSQIELVWFETVEVEAQIVGHRAYLDAVQAFLDSYDGG
jgi:hypothetical protein